MEGHAAIRVEGGGLTHATAGCGLKAAAGYQSKGLAHLAL